MLFSVIYEVECPRDGRIRNFAPPHRRQLWELTEDDAERNFDYLCNCKSMPCVCGWKRSKHRKWCGLLTIRQFREFVEKCNLYAQDVETMGSIGTPGCGSGVSPAISFTSLDSGSIISAYVTPIPEKLAELRLKKRGTTPLSQKAWERLRSAVIETFAL